MTAQLHENMIYEGRELSMFSFPGFPEDHPRVIELTDKQVWAKGEPRRVSSNCWRGYIGSWEIKEGKLYLLKLDRDYELEGDEPLFADWVTAELHIIMDSDFPELRAGLVGGEKIERVIIKNGVVIGANK
ncbi:MAG: hypothetical protein H8E18_07920 [FCB group bacterium]|nr:hypothetical protein [FCB group bacterium]